jgi:hypothetical protein
MPAVLKQSSWGFLHVVRVGGFGGVSPIDATAIKFVREFYLASRKSQKQFSPRLELKTERRLEPIDLRASCCYNRGNGCGKNATR